MNIRAVGIQRSSMRADRYDRANSRLWRFCEKTLKTTQNRTTINCLPCFETHREKLVPCTVSIDEALVRLFAVNESRSNTNSRTILPLSADHHRPETYHLVGTEVTSVSLLNTTMSLQIFTRLI